MNFKNTLQIKSCQIKLNAFWKLDLLFCIINSSIYKASNFLIYENLKIFYINNKHHSTQPKRLSQRIQKHTHKIQSANIYFYVFMPHCSYLIVPLSQWQWKLIIAVVFHISTLCKFNEKSIHLCNTASNLTSDIYTGLKWIHDSQKHHIAAQLKGKLK